MSSNALRRFASVRLLGLTCLMLLAALSACNRAEPEKSLGKEGKDAGISAGGGSGGGSDKGSGVGGTSPSDAGGKILPPGSDQFTSAANFGDNTLGGRGLDSPAATDLSGAGQTAQPPQAAGPQVPGVQIDTVPSIPSNGVDAAGEAEAVEAAARLADRPFMKLDLPAVALSAGQLIAFLGDSDRAVQDLTIARQANQLSEEEFIKQAKRLSGLKQKAGERLSAAADATPAQKKTGIAATVESLSQLTGLGDIQAAQTLQRVAGDLAASPDPDLAHQGRLVQFGFQLNQLFEGQIKDPQVLVSSIDQVLAQPSDRGLVEMLALQQCAGVMHQLGYNEQAKMVEQRIVSEYRNSDNKELVLRAWGIEVNNSPELNALHAAYESTFAGTQSDPSQLTAAAASLIKAYPSLATLSYFNRMVIDLEYSGKVEAARQLSDLMARAKSQLPAGPLLADIDLVLDGHARRCGVLGKPVQLEELVGFDGVPLDWSSYRGKVVLVYFWASWEVPSLNLINEVKQLRSKVTDPNFVVLGINIDDAHLSTNADQLVKRQALPWVNVRSSNANAQGLQTTSARILGVNAYPHFEFLVDQSGTVRAVHPSFEKLPAMIAELLAGKK